MVHVPPKRQNLPELWFVIELDEKQSQYGKCTLLGWGYLGSGVDSSNKLLTKPVPHGVPGAGEGNVTASQIKNLKCGRVKVF